MANVVVTGTSRGIGLEFVKQLTKIIKFSNIFALCRDPQSAYNLQEVAKNSPNVTVIKADMANFDDYQAVVSNIQTNIRSGGVNLLINNAGIMTRDTLKSIKYLNIMNSFETNAVAPLLFTKAMLPLLIKSDSSLFPNKLGNSIVLNISSQLGSIEENTSGGYLSYRLSKAALNMATRSLAAELKSSDVFVMALHPGWVKTDMGGESASLTSEKSVSGMLTVISKADKSFNGCLFNGRGQKIPW